VQHSLDAAGFMPAIVCVRRASGVFLLPTLLGCTALAKHDHTINI
jgi:hypothetical protein